MVVLGQLGTRRAESTHSKAWPLRTAPITAPSIGGIVAWFTSPVCFDKAASVITARTPLKLIGLHNSDAKGVPGRARAVKHGHLRAAAILTGRDRILRGGARPTATRPNRFSLHHLRPRSTWRTGWTRVPLARQRASLPIANAHRQRCGTAIHFFFRGVPCRAKTIKIRQQ